MKLLRYAIRRRGRTRRLIGIVCCTILALSGGIAVLAAGIAVVLLAARGLHSPKLRVVVPVTTLGGAPALTLATIGVTKAVKTWRNKKAARNPGGKKAAKASRNKKAAKGSGSNRPTKASRKKKAFKASGNNASSGGR